MAIKCTKMAVCNIFQMAKEYANLFHSKALQNVPKLVYLV
jgi:hypothetical protein